MTNAIIGFLPNLGMPEIIIILVAMLLLFGGKKLPELARGLGKGLRQFKEEVHSVKSDVTDAMDDDTDYSATSSTDNTQASDTTENADENKGADAV
ncbi:MAG: twin-arginine translocase TatA/TatE family subunit [Phycisphaerales bacterium]|jgi:sec-independent protein translocase protein TatA|nr:twin-arginine translocase TatA/TatE family subunit [Phycisphaerales bacterium]